MALLIMVAGMPADGAAQEVVVDFSDLPPAEPLPRALKVSGVAFVSHDLLRPPAVAGDVLERAYGFRHDGVTVVLPVAAKRVEIRLCLATARVTIEAFDAGGNPVSEQTERFYYQCADVLVEPGLMAEQDGIEIVRLSGGANRASIVRLVAKE